MDQGVPDAAQQCPTITLSSSVPPSSAQGFSTPQNSRMNTESDLTKTFTRKSVIPKDVSPIPDNSTLEGVSPRERDNIKSELDSMHEDYSKLYDTYKKMRKINEEQKLEYAGLHEKYVAKVEENKHMQGKMARLREEAKNKLEQASMDMETCLRERDESLVGLRLKVRQLEMDLKTSQRELEIKKNEAKELRDICNQLMSQVEPGSDVEQ
ncbi:unnamed protein product [Nippostrongylus brasiliensis]|uniref:2P40 (inferred by orthology to a C. elegans protein) n=1 Tax=Nippostrongylus brasiliensis TaxID=27835 RepID=A0A0N4XDL3_NIPBR|nr:unnamed protein product [Nippostrongylus brasiliensis]